MIIDKPKLVELLVDKTGMQLEDVESQLDQLIERIVDAANRGKALEIKEFGIFYFDEDGELKFEASDELSTEISFKYAGMRPVELKPERDSAMPPVDIEEKQDEDDDLDIPAVPLVESESSGTKEEDPFGFEEENQDDEFDFLSDLGGQTDDEDEKLLSADPEPEPVRDPEKKPEPTQKKPPVKKIAPRKKNNTSTIAILAILLLVILIGGTIWFMDSLNSDPESPQTASNMNMPVQVPDELPVITDDDIDNMDELSEQESNLDTPSMEQEAQTGVQESTEPAPTAAESVSEQPTYGLMGVVQEEANDGYSIVIHSFTTENTARSTAALLVQDGYRTLVNSRTVTGSSVWRVSVGQFATLGDAQQAAQQLPSPYNTQNFIQRIQIN